MRPLLLILLLGLPLLGQVQHQGDAAERFGAALLVHDLDGDGAAELCIGAPRYTKEAMHGQGRVRILPGTKGDQQKAAVDWVGATSTAYFGSSLATGDWNGDGHPDLAIGAPGYDENRGRVVLLLGGRNGGGILQGGELFRSRSTLAIEGDTKDGLFGGQLAAGDFDGDGLDDLVITAPYLAHKASPYCGQVFVLRGRKTWKGGRLGEKGLQPDWTIVGRENEALGLTVATGDLNGDGMDDLALSGARPPSVDQGRKGRVVILLGARELALKPTERVLDHEPADREFPGGSTLGLGLATLDLDGDGSLELLAGEPGASGGRRLEGAGRLHLLGMGTPRLQPLTGPEAPPRRTGLTAHEGFGGCMLAGSWTGQAAPDLLIASPTASRVILLVDPSSLDAAPTAAFMPKGSARGFGTALAAGDLNGDGQLEVAVGAPEAGKVFVFTVGAK